MIVLGLVWLGLLILELTRGLGPLLENASLVILVIFIVDFLLRFAIAPHKLPFLRGNWLTVMVLVVPALRVFRLVRVLRVLRLARASRSLHRVRVITSPRLSSRWRPAWRHGSHICD